MQYQWHSVRYQSSDGIVTVYATGTVSLLMALDVMSNEEIAAFEEAELFAHYPLHELGAILEAVTTIRSAYVNAEARQLHRVIVWRTADRQYALYRSAFAAIAGRWCIVHLDSMQEAAAGSYLTRAAAVQAANRRQQVQTTSRA